MSPYAQRQNVTLNLNALSPMGPDREKSRCTITRIPYLQQRLDWGNQAMQRLLLDRVIQAKLNINTPGDQYEQEADKTTEKVIRMPEPDIQRKPG